MSCNVTPSQYILLCSVESRAQVPEKKGRDDVVFPLTLSETLRAPSARTNCQRGGTVGRATAKEKCQLQLGSGMLPYLIMYYF